MIKIAICEDRNADIKKITDLLQKYGKSYRLHFVMSQYNSGEELLKEFRNQYDIIILDVEMKKLNGIDTALNIRKTDSQVVILFATLHRGYAYDSYKVNACDFMHKPINYDVINISMKKALNKIEQRKKEIEIKYNGVTRFIEISSILHIEYYNHYITYHLLNGEEIKVSGSIKAVIKQDSTGKLYQIHKNCIVNIIWIEKCEKQSVYLKGIEAKFEVSRNKYKELENNYIQFCHERLS